MMFLIFACGNQTKPADFGHILINESLITVWNQQCGNIIIRIKILESKNTDSTGPYSVIKLSRYLTPQNSITVIIARGKIMITSIMVIAAKIV